MTGTNLQGSPAMEHGVSRSADEWYSIGYTAMRNQQISEAAEAFRAALVVNPNHANANYRLGEVAEYEGQPDRAKAFYYRALAAQPEHKAALKKLGRLTASVASPTPGNPSETPPDEDADISQYILPGKGKVPEWERRRHEVEQIELEIEREFAIPRCKRRSAGR